MIKRCLLFLLLIASCGAFAQSSADSSKHLYLNKGNHHALGINLGFTTGAGLSYRFKHNWWAVQAVAMPWIVKYDGEGTLSLGLSNYVYLRQSEKLSVFLCLGVHNYSTNKLDLENTNYIHDTRYKRIHYLNIGFGPGLEVPVFYDLNFHLMAGYAAYNVLNSPKTSFTLDLGFCYYFR